MTVPQDASAPPGEEILHRASAMHRQGRRAEAIELFKQGLEISPGSAEAWYELGYAFKAEGRYSEAQHAFGQALANAVDRAHEVHLNRAVLYADHLRRDDDAQAELEAAIALQPGYLPALINLGNLHEQRGDRAQALDCYDRILAEPALRSGQDASLHWVALGRSAIMRPPTSSSDPLFGQLRDAIALVAGDHAVRANLLFALAQSHHRLGAYDEAYDAFAKANRCLLRQSGRQYDRTHASRLTTAFIEAFPSAVTTTSSAPEAGATPLFICGMFRSGSTLVEQVLAAHPKVIAGGELDWLLRVAAERMAPFPASMSKFAAPLQEQLADEYRAHLAQLFPSATAGMWITDKRPDNFQLIGLIKRLFPSARIIHTTRHPVDNGLSIFMQNINLQVAAYAGDLADIGHYYGEYRRLMAHWKVLYPHDILDFDYDEFVREPEPALRRLLGFLGLDWDPRCLEFHTLRNTVKTASYWQVRRPLYVDASGRWKRYAAHLGPLLQALHAANVAETGN